jgi:cation diffusion facilitator CzcD-associated flavoprotein CzcO
VKKGRTSKPRIAIVGAGLGGVAAAVYLKKSGYTDITILEKSPGPGGTWWDNTYPGCECDVQIDFYSYSFTTYPWKKTHATQVEIQQYISTVIEEYGLSGSVRYNAKVESVRWLENSQRYAVTIAGVTSEFDIVVSAVGMLNVPNVPNWPGVDRFKPVKFHTARWQHQHDLAGKRVAVVGTGATAAQVIPELAKIAGDLLMFSREPAYVLPKNERELTVAEFAETQSPPLRRKRRWRALREIERLVSFRTPGSRLGKSSRDFYLNYVSQVFADRPDLAAYATPDYPFGCKRPILSTTFYPALKSPNVRVIPKSVVSLTETGVVDDQGEEHEVDALVMATGFKAWDYLSTYTLVGRQGRTLKEVWGDNPEAYLGIQVADFPNFFIMYGPNTNYFCVTYMLEQQAQYIARMVRKLDRSSGTSIEVRRAAMKLYSAIIKRSLANKTTEAGCHNYYHTATGRNVVTYPWRGMLYWLLTRLPLPTNAITRSRFSGPRGAAFDIASIAASDVTMLSSASTGEVES